MLSQKATGLYVLWSWSLRLDKDKFQLWADIRFNKHLACQWELANQIYKMNKNAIGLILFGVCLAFLPITFLMMYRFWQYDNRVITTTTSQPKVYHWYYDGKKVTGDNPFPEDGDRPDNLIVEYCGIGSGTTTKSWTGEMHTKCSSR